LQSALDVVDEAGHWPADVVGYSMGGRIALHLAATRPERVRRLVLESSSPGLDSEDDRVRRKEDDDALAARIEEGGVEAFVEEWARLPLFASQARVDPMALRRQREIRLANDGVGLAAALRKLGTGSLPSLWGSLPQVAVPVLIIVGALDAKFMDIGERMADALPHARLVVVSNTGHCVHLERPDVWMDAVGSFMADS
jgi:2-succinyl-6-hydroxy-2,4-cyclohexadiene-1-carboxylate synthase